MRTLRTAMLAASAALAPLARLVDAQTPPDNRSCRVAYEIRARYDAPTRGLSGSESILWVNHTADEVRDVWLHLYWNAFANDRSLHLIESGGKLRGTRIRPEEWGWQRITKLEVDGVDVLASLRHRFPDEEPSGDRSAGEDRTVVSAELPRAIRPGEAARIDVAWEARMPRVRRRTGYKDDFLFVAQWFPKLGVYEGGRGWNAHQFHASTEFYADYGTYDVTLDLPAEYAGKVGATGVVAGPAKRDGDRVELRFLAPSERDRARRDRTGAFPLVHDFAWTADPDFVVHRDTFQYDDWAARFSEEVDRVQRALGASEDVALREVDVTVLMQPEHAAQAERHHEATCAALFFYGLWFGEYPYEHITVVDPAWGGGAAGGMEYPTLFTAGTRLYSSADTHSPEGVTVHECGHQFWYGLVGNNEFEAAWLDEGFNSYTDAETLWRRYGHRRAKTRYAGIPFDGVHASALPGGGALADLVASRAWKLPALGWTPAPLASSGFVDLWRDQPWATLVAQRDDPRWDDRIGYLADPDTDPIDTPGWQYQDRTSYRTNSYPRTAAALRSIAGVIGHDAFLRGMRHYAKTWRYRHPYPQDFYAAFSEGAGVDLSWYFDELFRGTGTVDWSVSVEQRRVAEPRGWFQTDARTPFVERDARDDADADADEERDESEDGGDEGGARKRWSIEVVIDRKGTLRLPLIARLTYAGGRVEELTWSREEQASSTWLRRRVESDEKLESVVLDPERLYYLDQDMSDNQWYADDDAVAPLRWSERVYAQYARLLHFYAGVGG